MDNKKMFPNVDGKTNELGISLYLSSGFEKNKEIIKKASEANIHFAFTSLHIPEEKVEDYATEVKQLLDQCIKNQIHLFVDVSPHTLEKLKIENFKELKESGVSHLRLDFGFTYDEMVSLSQDFYIVLNASTFLKKDYDELKKRGADFSSFLACHNFYPQPYTGLSLEKVQEMNKRMHDYGIKVMGFVSGDKELRGPLYQGLPTMESHRNKDVIENVQQLIMETEMDIVLIGDIDVVDETWRELELYHENIVEIECELEEGYHRFYNELQYDRPDSSDYMIRTEASRVKLKTKEKINPSNNGERKLGDVCIANQLFLRYMGELSIVRQDMPKDERVNIIGRVSEKHRNRLRYIHSGAGFVMIKK